MVKNLIFDVGGVLLDFNIGKTLARFKFSSDEILHLKRTIFSSKLWRDVSDGRILIETFKNEICKLCPQYKKQFSEIFDTKNMETLMPAIKENVLLCGKAIENGYNVYLLSNTNFESINYILSCLPFSLKLSGAVFSCKEKLSKPDERFFKVLLDRYNLNPCECLMIDDKEKNLVTAKKLGMETLHFIFGEKGRDELIDLVSKKQK